MFHEWCGQSHKTVSINHHFWREEKGEPQRIEPRSFCLPAERRTARPHRLATGKEKGLGREVRRRGSRFIALPNMPSPERCQHVECEWRWQASAAVTSWRLLCDFSAAKYVWTGSKRCGVCVCVGGGVVSAESFCFNSSFITNCFSFLSSCLSFSVFMVFSTVFHSINSPDDSPLSHSVLPVFISALLFLSTIYLFMKVYFEPDIILCGWLGLKYQLTN